MNAEKSEGEEPTTEARRHGEELTLVLAECVAWDLYWPLRAAEPIPRASHEECRRFNSDDVRRLGTAGGCVGVVIRPEQFVSEGEQGAE